MIRNRMSVVLMSALGAALSAGAAAVEHAAEVILADIKSAFGLRHAVTGQVNEFDTREAAEGFLASATDSEHWTTADGIKPAAPQPATPIVTVDLAELRASLAADSSVPSDTAPNETALQAAESAPAAAETTKTAA